MTIFLQHFFPSVTHARENTSVSYTGYHLNYGQMRDLQDDAIHEAKLSPGMSHLISQTGDVQCCMDMSTMALESQKRRIGTRRTRMSGYTSKRIQLNIISNKSLYYETKLK